MCDDYPKGVMFKGRFCVLWGGLYLNDSDSFYKGTIPRVSRTIKAGCHDAAVVVEISAEKAYSIDEYYKKQNEMKILRIGNLTNHERNREIDRVYSANALSPGLTTFQGGGREPKILETIMKKGVPHVKFNGKKVAIRKLTPYECLRLMGVNEDNIDKARKSGITKTNIYKMAGNSIVVQCMTGIFEQLFYPKNQKGQQLKLF